MSLAAAYEAGSSLVECLVALVIAVSAAAAAFATLRTCAILQKRLEAEHQLTTFGIAIDSLYANGNVVPTDEFGAVAEQLAQRLGLESCKLRRAQISEGYLRVTCRAPATPMPVSRSFRVLRFEEVDGE